MRRCSRCLYDETVPNITFDGNGTCNYCKIHDNLNQEYPTGAEGQRRLHAIADQIRKEGRGKPYDVVVGVSGGADSSYMLYLTKQLGLRPLAAHFDNTWNSTVAVENIHNVLKKLDVDLYTYVVDNKEYDDIYRSFLKAGVIDIDAQTDIGLAAVLNMAAEKHGIRYIFEGHSFRTEGVAPLGWIYMDSKYIESVQRRYGTVPIKTLPNMLMPNFIKWTAWLGIKKIRPLYFVDYIKEDAMKLLADELDWKWYGGHHLENRWTAFTHTYFFPRRYQTDTRLLGYSSLVRSGQVTRKEGLEMLKQPQILDENLLDLVIKRLGLSYADLEMLMDQPKHTYREFVTYKRTFERMRPFWWLMYKLNRVPKSFYMKFCFPDPSPKPGA